MSAEDHDSKGAAVIDRRYSPIFSQLLGERVVIFSFEFRVSNFDFRNPGGLNEG